MLLSEPAPELNLNSTYHCCPQAAQQQKQQQQHAAHQPGQPPHFNQAEFWRAAFRAAPREVQSDLEMSFVEKVRLTFG